MSSTEDAMKKFSADMDQMLTGLENIATMVAAYRTHLLEKGIPPLLADEMALEFSKSLLPSPSTKKE